MSKDYIDPYNPAPNKPNFGGQARDNFLAFAIKKEEERATLVEASLDERIKHVEESTVGYITVEENPENNFVTITLLDVHENPIDSATIEHLPGKLIRSAELVASTSSLDLICQDGERISCNFESIFSRIADLETTKEDISNKVTSLSDRSTNIQYPSAKAVYDYVSTEGGKINSISIDGVAQPIVNKNVDLPTYPTRESLNIDNVDNTSDLDKPISTATQAALDLKAADSAVVHNTGDESISGDKTFTDVTIHNDGVIFDEDIYVRKGLIDSAGNRVEIKDISHATNLENGTGNGSLIQANAVLSGVSWSSSDDSIATVSEEGLVTAVGYGEATITATYGNAHDTCNVVVSGRPMLRMVPSGLAGYDIVEDLSEVDENTDLYLVTYDSSMEEYIGVTGWNGSKDATTSTSLADWVAFRKGSDDSLYDTSILDNSPKYIKQAISSNEFIYVNERASTVGHFSIDVDNDNVLLNVNGSTRKHLAVNGNYVRFYNSTSTYALKFKVYTRHIEPVTGVELDEHALEIELGENVHLEAFIEPYDATDKSVTWTTSDSSVVAVENTTGLTNELTAMGVGNATVTVTTHDGSFTDTCDITVKHTIHVEGISLNQHSMEIEVSEIGNLVATIIPPDATDKTVIWTSGDEFIATVNNGVVTGVGVGTAIITATTIDGGFSDSCSVKVKPLTRIVLNTHNLKLKRGETAQLEARYLAKNEAIGESSVVLGNNNIVRGNNAFVQGDHLVANIDGQVVFGSYNEESIDKFIIGNGDEEERKTIFRVNSRGQVFASGKFKSSASTSGSDSDTTLTTKDYVDSKTGGDGSITIGSTTLTEAQLIKLINLLDSLEVEGE